MKKDKIIFKQATKEYAENFYGDKPAKSFRGYVAILGDKVVGIGGVTVYNSNMMLFSEMKDEMRPFKRDIVKSIRILKEFISNYKYPIMAIASNTEPISEKILTTMGFEKTSYTTLDGPVYRRGI